jgi:hypothetical protein
LSNITISKNEKEINKYNFQKETPRKNNLQHQTRMRTQQPMRRSPFHCSKRSQPLLALA